MILGFFNKNKNQILNLNARYFCKACDIIENYNFTNIDDGKYEEDGLDFYYLIKTYKTNSIKQEVYAEAHREYIDFQYILYGAELFGYAEYENSKQTISDYDIEKDIEVFSSISNESFFILKKDMFVIFYPNEIHRPGIARDEIRSVRKVIFKILAKEAK